VRPERGSTIPWPHESTRFEVYGTMIAKRWIGRRVVLLAVLGLALGLAACGPRPPRYGEVAAQVAPVAADRARLFIYRDYEPYESLGRPYLYLNGQRIGISEPGGVLFRDVVPGTYLISVDSVGVYPNQFKTLAMRAGETYYSKITSLRSWVSGGIINEYQADTFVVVLVDAEQARREMPSMWFFGGP
jgi:hypothetical protein